jgi:hypothetical protein
MQVRGGEDDRRAERAARLVRAARCNDYRLEAQLVVGHTLTLSAASTD